MSDLRGKKVLLAEDNPVVREIAKTMLEQFGVEVISVGTGKEAVSAVTQSGIDCVLMDCRMPEMDGIEAAEKIRASKNNIPIIALTGSMHKIQKDKCMQSGMNDYLSKPFHQKELQSILLKWAV